MEWWRSQRPQRSEDAEGYRATEGPVTAERMRSRQPLKNNLKPKLQFLKADNKRTEDENFVMEKKMKKPLKMSAVAGIVLSVLSALFCISLLLTLFDFGGMNPAHNTIFYRFGKMFTSVYGLCSILIPLFLILAVIQCFAESWTVRRGVMMLGAFIPFFTLDALEHVCRMMIGANEGPVLAVKLSAALLTGALIILVELLLLSLLGDVIEKLSDDGEGEDSVDAAEQESGEEADEAVSETADDSDSDEVLTFEKDRIRAMARAREGVTFAASGANALASYDSQIEGNEVVQEAEADEADEIAESEVEALSENEEFEEPEKDISHLDDGSVNPFLKLFEKKDEGKAGDAGDVNEAEAVSEAEAETIEEDEAPADRPAPQYNENVTRYEPEYLNRPRYGENESSELQEMESFNPEIDSFDGDFNAQEETAELEEEKEFEDDDSEFLDDAGSEDLDSAEIDGFNALEDDGVEETDVLDESEVAAVEDEADADADAADDTMLDPDATLSEASEDAAEAGSGEESDSFDDDFFDIDMNAEDEEELAEKQKSEGSIGSLDSIFSDMDEDAFREPVIDGDVDAVKDAEEDFSMFEEPVEEVEEGENGEPVDAIEEAEFVEDELFEDDLIDDEREEQKAAANRIDDVDESEFGLGEKAEESESARVVSSQGAGEVDPLLPPVVDADGVPYATSIPIDLEDMDFDSYSANAGASAGASDGFHASLSPAEKAAASQKTRIIGAGGEAVRMGDTEPKAKQPKRRISQYKIPTEGILESYTNSEYWVIDEETKQAGEDLRDTLNEFKIEAEVTGIRKGPVVTMFEILPAPGVKLSKIVALQDNIALRLAASSVRIVAPIPGKHAVGIEVPNKERAIVGFKEIIDRDLPQYKKMAVPVVLGKDISGEPQIIDLAKTPHLLIAGSTGAGKSVCVNSMILSILFKRSPEDVKMILIDPKIVELKLYNDIPHLLTPVITEPKRAFQSLQYCLSEMERRYALLDGMGVRDIISYNNRIKERHIATERLPYIIVVIDEFADLMATTGKELESTLARLAAMSRAVGIHLVLATQRPSIDVITGLIKANIPSRIAFMVASKMDSRIIIDQVGAEKLLGKGDMLYASATDPFPVRIQGTLVSDDEVERTVDYVKSYGEPEYIDDEIFVDDDEDGGNPGLFGDGEDPLYDEALQIVMQAGKASASYIQRRLKIGYNRAARLVEEMEERGIVGPANGSKPREVIHVPV